MKSPKFRKHSRRALQDLECNPFTRDTLRNHRPGLDGAFIVGNSDVKKNNTSRHGESGMNDISFGGHTNSSSPEQLCDHESSIVSSWELDMSIGARAAIYEQTRYVAKFGLDGEGGGNPNNRSSTMDEWDRIMDASMSYTSFSSTFITDHDASSSSFLHHPSQNGNNLSTSYVRGAVAVLNENRELDMDEDNLNSTIDQSDYFNSSRVANLYTPEKNKSKVDEASRRARLGMIGGENPLLGRLMDKNMSTCRIPFPSIGNMVEEKLHKSHSISVDGSSESGELGMAGLFNAALQLEEETNDHEVASEGCADHHPRNQELLQEPESLSFVSFHEPNLSVVHEDFGHYIDEIAGIDAQESFISYRDPDLSLMSPDRDDSNQAHSDFDVDVSEIIAPSEIESKVGASVSVFPHNRSSFIHDEFSSTTPNREKNCARFLGDLHGASRLPVSSLQISEGANMHSRGINERANPRHNLNSEDEHVWLNLPPKNKHSNTKPRVSIPQICHTDEEHNFFQNLNVQGSSSNEKHKKTCSQQIQSFQSKTTSPQGISSLSSNSTFPKNGDQNGRHSPIPAQNFRQISLPIPRKISLRERYSRSDRFEDSYSSADHPEDTNHLSPFH